MINVIAKIEKVTGANPKVLHFASIEGDQKFAKTIVDTSYQCQAILKNLHIKSYAELTTESAKGIYVQLVLDDQDHIKYVNEVQQKKPYRIVWKDLEDTKVATRPDNTDKQSKDPVSDYFATINKPASFQRFDPCESKPHCEQCEKYENILAALKEFLGAQNV